MQKVNIIVRIPVSLYKQIGLSRESIHDEKGRPISFNKWFVESFKEKIDKAKNEKDSIII